MFDLKIKFPTLMDIQREWNPELHKKVFTDAANDVVLRSIPKLNTQLKRKWNVLMMQTDSYNWVLASAMDRKYATRGGRMNFSSAKQDHPVIVITMDGSPINDIRFNASFANEIASLAGTKKQARVIKAQDRFNKKNPRSVKSPRVKILKQKNPTILPHNAFYATMPNGHYGIFRRKGKKIIELRTITLPSMLEQIDYSKILSHHYQENMTNRYYHYLVKAIRK